MQTGNAKRQLGDRKDAISRDANLHPISGGQMFAINNGGQGEVQLQKGFVRHHRIFPIVLEEHFSF